MSSQKWIEEFVASFDLSHMQAMVTDGTIKDVNEVPVNEKHGHAALHWQCLYRSKIGSLERVQFLLGCVPPANPNNKNKIGMTSLHYAIFTEKGSGSGDDPDLVRLLLEFGADRSIKDNSGKTALDIAKDNKAYKSIEVLENYHPNLPLHSACWTNKHVDVIASLLASYPEAVRSKIGNKNLPLHISLDKSAPFEVVSLLLSAYPESAREEDMFSNLPLHISLKKSAHVEVVSLLLSAYPESVRKKGISKNLPLHISLDKSAPVEVISLLLSAYPESVREKGRLGKLPLHISLEKSTPFEAVSLLLSAYPESAREEDIFSNLPLHISLEKSAPVEVVSLLLSAYPESARERDKNRNLPLHIALEKSAPVEVISLLLSAYPESARKRDRNGKLPLGFLYSLNKSLPIDVVAVVLAVFFEVAGEIDGSNTNRDIVIAAAKRNMLPLHYACESGTSIQFITSLITAYPESARERDSANKLPLHVSLENSAPIEVVSLLLSAYPESARAKDNDGSLPLHISLDKSAPIEVVSLLLSAYPESACAKNNDGNLPLHISSEKSTPFDVLSLLLSAYPESARERDNDGNLPLHISSEKNCSFNTLVVLLDFTTRCTKPGEVVVTGLPEFLISHGEQRVDAFAAFLDLRSLDIPLLANTPDSNGRTALSTAGPKCRAVLKQRLFLCSRYELGEQVHSSFTSRVYFAIDHDPATSSLNGAPPRVALKFLRHREHFKAEIDARKQASAAKASFISIIASFDGDFDSDFNAELVARNLESHRFMLVMPAGDRSFESAIVAESAEADWPIEAKRGCCELAEALVVLHSAGFVHGDVKPRNVVRVGVHYKLIDFDAAVAIGSPQAGKLSTAYAPPEAYIIDDGGASWGRVERRTDLVASTAADAWSFGVTLYRAMRNSTLVRLVANDDADGESELRAIAEWSDTTKDSLLSSVSDAVARNLLGQLLHKDPKKRPSLARALRHPFFTGNNNYTRLVGFAPLYDVFLSYRADSDANHVQALYEALTRQGLKVFWDDPSLPGGKNWEQGFCSGLMNSATFVFLLSREAINSDPCSRDNAAVLHSPRRNIANLTCSSECDNVVLEWRLAKELSDMGMIDGIFPVLIGDKDPTTSLYSDYFLSGCHPSLEEDVVVAKVESKLVEHLEREGLGSPLTPSMGVKSLLSSICSNQGQKIGSNDAHKPYKDFNLAIERTVDKIVKMVTTAKSNYEKHGVANVTPPPPHPHPSSLAVTWIQVTDADGTVKFVSSNGETFLGTRI